ncbi:MAG: hypothetical protein REI11_00480 [Patulibacter sp.]|nr:hypothetical protein [Patulibacter sp.]
MSRRSWLQGSPAAGRLNRAHRSLRAALATTALALALPAVAAAAPAAPTGLQVNATGPKQVALTWNASTTPNITGYTIYRGSTAIAIADLNSPNYVDTSSSLVNGTSYTYSVDAFDGSGHSTHATTVSGTPVAAAPSPLVGCSGTVALAPGHYTLGTNLTAAAGKPCFTFGTGSNLSLDCGGHSITQAGSSPNVIINGVDKFLFTNCNLSQTSSGGRLLVVNNGSYGAFLDNTFSSPTGSGNGGDSLDFQTSPHAVVGEINHGNTFTNAYVEANSSPYTYEGYNTFTDSGSTNGVASFLTRSNYSTAVGNSIDGGSPTSPSLDNGFQLNGPNTHMTVSSNTINHLYGTGIEPTDTMTYSHFDYNTISNAVYAGIGEYWDTDFHDNSVIGNQIDHVQHAFMFSVAWDHSDDGTPYHPSSYSVSNNLFSGNVWTYPSATTDPTSAIRWELSTEPDGSPLQLPISATGNVFTGNDFGPYTLASSFESSGATNVSSSTGNYCLSSVAIQCIGKPIITAGTAPSRNTDGSYALRAYVDPSGADTSSTAIQYGKTTSYGTTTSASQVLRGHPAQIGITTSVLSPATTYHYRAVVTNAYGLTIGPDQTFTTP